MYDFYAKPPKTKEEIREWLTTWLEPAFPTPTHPLEVNGENFIQELGFRRAFHKHCVFRSLKTGEYVWWVVSDDNPPTPFPNRRFATYEDLLNTLVDEYFTLFNSR